MEVSLMVRTRSLYLLNTSSILVLPTIMNRIELNKLSNDELIDYIFDLQGEIFDLKSINGKLNIDNSKLKSLSKDILNSSIDIIKKNEENIRFDFGTINFEESFNNLIKYIQEYCRKEKIYL